MINSLLNKGLEQLGFEDKLSKATFFYTTKSYHSDEMLFDERLVFETAKKLKATAVFFRRFSESQSSKAQIFIFDNTRAQFSDDELAELHRKIWSSGIIPLYYVFDNTNINIYDARKQVDYDTSSKKISVSPFSILPIVTDSYEEYKKYSATLFTNGTFWEQKIAENNFLTKGSSESKLIEELKKVRAHFIEETALNNQLSHQLLVLSILVKYLEERKDEHGNHVFPSDYFSRYSGASSFCEVLRQGKIVELFNDLSTHFNGKVFELNPDDQKVLEKTNLDKLASYFDANIDNNQLVLWPLYSFEYIPVELISRIYEEFVDQRKDAVFTPIHLARLMVDECMPISDPKEDFKVIDVSCGSGVFLVAVYKRLVQWWQKRQFEKTGQLLSPTKDDLKAILKNSVYGVDIEDASVRLSVFSLSITLCDMLTPTEIWTELRFDDLRKKNIYHGDFFKYLNKADKPQFDLVIGNPPFEDKKKDFNKLLELYDINCEYHIPVNQIAMLFLQQAMQLLKPDGLLSFVMPSGPLLYNNTIDFRKEFFSRYTIPQIIDLSELRDASILFEKSVATAVVFAYNTKPPQNHIIQHIGVKRTRASKERLFFEIDNYDINPISQEAAENDLAVWKSNLMGGNQLYFFVKRLQKFRTLGSYLISKRKTNGWFFGEGYNYGNKSKRANYLTGKRLVESKDFKEEGIINTCIEKEIWFEGIRTKNKLIFKSPHLLIKERLGKKRFIMEKIDYDLIFKDDVVGIYCPPIENKELIEVQNFLNDYYSTLKAYVLACSGRAGIGRSGGYILLKKDIMNLPYPICKDDISLSSSENNVVKDVLNYRLEELSRGERAKVNTQLASTKVLEEFGSVFCDSLNAIYKKGEKEFKALNPIKTFSYTIYPFVYGDETFSPVISDKVKDGNLSELIENQQNAVHYRRVMRLYQKDLVFLVKPNTLRYWLKSIALRDASDVMNDLINSGY